MAYYQTKPAAGRHFLQIPGPTNVPDRVLRAMDNPTMDHRGPDFGKLGAQVLSRLKQVFQTEGHVVIYPASGTGAWEAALANTLSPGDTVLMCRTGWFAHLWHEMANRLGLVAEFIETDWRRGADVPAIAEALAKDTQHRIKAVCVVHNETSTGCTSRIDEVRAAVDAAKHPALLMVDTISSLGSIDYKHDAWGVDVTIAGSQKGLMLPPGLSFNAVSAKALAAAETAKLPRSYWDWRPMLAANATGYFPFTPATNLLYGLDAACGMLLEEGLANVFARHDRFAEATRRAVRAWGLEIQCAEPRHYSSALTAVRVPEGHSANALRATILERFNMSLGNGLGQLNDRVFRIGHLGDFGDLQLVGTLGGVEMGLRAAGIPHKEGGVQAALGYLAGN
ncbi:MAG: aminotransferase class V-fold PLP-dependent enzyme [Alphaproteobacteria bacterium]|nr:aminotransferase class V-fold PLP-dependent enzyme [Alphaproteobacteria bacterium]